MAASIILVGTLTLFLLQEKENVVVPENTVTTIDSSKNTIPTPESANGFVNTTPEIKKKRNKFYNNNRIQNNIVINDTINYKSKKEVVLSLQLPWKKFKKWLKRV